MPEYSPIPFSTYYSQNYSIIIDMSLILIFSSVSGLTRSLMIFLHSRVAESTICVAQQKLLDDLEAFQVYNWMCSASVNMEKSFQWLQQSLYNELQSTLFAMQDQVINFSPVCVYQAKILGFIFLGESIQHVLTGFSILTPTYYLSCLSLASSKCSEELVLWLLSSTCSCDCKW